jgi:hypothetical protein
MTLPTPIVGDWYEGRDGAVFEVVAIDSDDHTIEVQHFDGTLEELDMDSWVILAPQETEAPEDWTGSLDIEPEDHDNEVELAVAPHWLGAGHLDRDEVSGYSELPLPH